MVTSSQPVPAEQVRSRSLVLQFASFAFALLQSACTLFMALSGVRLLLGIGALALAGSAQSVAGTIHGPLLRIPMLLFAVVASVLNLAALHRVRSLRRRASSQWRMTPPDAGQLRSERWQLVLSVTSILLAAVESAFHYYLHGTI